MTIDTSELNIHFLYFFLYIEFYLVFISDSIFLQVRFQICGYLWGSRAVRPVNFDIPYFNLLLLVAFVLKHNLAEKICKILTSEFT